MDISKLTTEQLLELDTRLAEARKKKPEPKWSGKEGFWKKATEQGSVNGKDPEDYIKRCELVAVLGREGLFDD